MRESENSVQETASFGPEVAQRICANLLADRPRYATWVASQDWRMWRVARGKQRERQLIDLRLAATEQIHRAALVGYLRDNNIVGRERSVVLREFYGPLDSACAILAEHRSYTRAVSSRLCAIDLLTLSHDSFGVRLIGDYEHEYAIWFAMHCDRARAISEGRRYLLASLMPDVRANAASLRTRLLAGERLPARRITLPKSARLPVANQPFDGHARITIG
jgi:hypothetical protein